jgi:uncharacterized protein YlxW (UPF0749 family)
MKEYKSPVSKLIAFFEKSRDAWKAKCLEAKYSVKKLRNQVRYLAARKKELKQRVRELEAALCELRARERSQEPETSKKSLLRG